MDESPLTIAEIALQFSVSESAIYACLARRKATGSFAPKPHAGGRALSVDEDGGKLLGRLVEAQNDRTLAEYADAYEQAHGVRLSRAALHRALVRLDLPRKKKHSAPPNRTGPM